MITSHSLESLKNGMVVEPLQEDQKDGSRIVVTCPPRGGWLVIHHPPPGVRNYIVTHSHASRSTARVMEYIHNIRLTTGQPLPIEPLPPVQLIIEREVQVVKLVERPVATMKVRVLCAYCLEPIDGVLTEDMFTLTLRSDTRVTPMRCGSCDAISGLNITVRKVRPSNQGEERRKLRQQIEIQNEQIAHELLADARCVCAQNKPPVVGDTKKPPPVGRPRPDGLLHGGMYNGLPRPPTHRMGCPALIRPNTQ